MSVRIRCPLCNASHSVNERVLGREIQCPSCDEKIRLPSAEAFETLKREHEEVEQFNAQLTKSLGGLSPPERSSRLFDDSPQGTGLDQAEHRAAEVRLGDALKWFAESGDLSGGSPMTGQDIEREEKDLADASVSFLRPGKFEDAEMDMTPMIDVTFLLLIFFLVTASFIVQKSIQRPAEKNDDPSLSVVVRDEDPDSVVVQVDESNAYNVVIAGVDTPAASKQDLIVLLSNAFANNQSSNRPTKLVVDAHENCIHAAVVGALDAGREAQFENFEVRTVEQFD